MKMKSKKITFIVNPSSGNGVTGKEWPRIRMLAKNRLGQFNSHITTGPNHATHLARKAVNSGTDIIICVGGDGTLNEVVNGLMNKKGPMNPGVLLGLIPSGTGCDLAKTISIPKDLEQNLENIRASRFRILDLGRAIYGNHEGGSSYRYFHNVLSFGMGGEVVDRVNRTTKAFGGFFSFIWGTIISLLIFEKKQIKMMVDDHFHEDLIGWHVAVANGQYQGGGMHVAPDASPNDGLFQLTVIGNMHKAEVFWNLPKLYNGKIYVPKKVTRLTGRRIKASSSQRVLLDMDGEQPGQLPVTVDIVPSAIRVICDKS
jgi:diacylglycerol kinase (ATP)